MSHPCNQQVQAPNERQNPAYIELHVTLNDITKRKFYVGFAKILIGLFHFLILSKSIKNYHTQQSTDIALKSFSAE